MLKKAASVHCSNCTVTYDLLRFAPGSSAAFCPRTPWDWGRRVPGTELEEGQEEEMRVSKKQKDARKTVVSLETQQEVAESARACSYDSVKRYRYSNFYGLAAKLNFGCAM